MSPLVEALVRQKKERAPKEPFDSLSLVQLGGSSFGAFVDQVALRDEPFLYGFLPYPTILLIHSYCYVSSLIVLCSHLTLGVFFPQMACLTVILDHTLNRFPTGRGRNRSGSC